MRLRVEVKVDEPLLRAVTVYSSLLQKTESFVVQCERLPIYCFSCGLLGDEVLTRQCPCLGLSIHGAYVGAWRIRRYPGSAPRRVKTYILLV
jgi:hypothetical protein